MKKIIALTILIVCILLASCQGCYDSVHKKGVDNFHDALSSLSICAFMRTRENDTKRLIKEFEYDNGDFYFDGEYHTFGCSIKHACFMFWGLETETCFLRLQYSDEIYNEAKTTYLNELEKVADQNDMRCYEYFCTINNIVFYILDKSDWGGGRDYMFFGYNDEIDTVFFIGLSVVDSEHPNKLPKCETQEDLENILEKYFSKYYDFGV